MDTVTTILALLSVTLLGVTWHAWRLGNERRDVALLGAFATACGMGTAVAASL